MGALFSVPMLSFLLIPTMSSYSTSLNLLFFYLTWTTLVLSHPPLRVELVGVAAVRLLFFVLPSLLFFLFDTAVPSAAAVIKIQGEDGLPGGRRKKVGKKELKVAAWAVFNVFLSIVAQSLVEYFLTRVLGVKSALRVSTKLPMPWGIVKDLARGFLAREVCILSIPSPSTRKFKLLTESPQQIIHYSIHRSILHPSSQRRSYPSCLSSRHASWHHSLPTAYPLTAHYDHPAPYLALRFLPTFLPAALFRFHLLTYLVYLTIISLEETFAYSGYKTLPTSFLVGEVARRVEAHLEGGGKSDFGPWGVLDWAFGTGGEEEGGEGGGSEGDWSEVDVREIAEKILRERRSRSKSKGKSRNAE